MTIPLLGPVSLSGFTHLWWFLLFLIVVAVLVALYVVAQIRRRRRLQQFTNTELLESVATSRPSRWRHVPAALLAISLLLCTIALAGPTHDQRLPRNRAVVVLAIDVSQSMNATDVEPSRLAAAQEASKKFVDELTPGINLGVIAFAGTATVLVSPTTNRDASRRAIDNLQVAERTATGEAILTSLSSISTVGAVIGGGDEPPPAHIVLFSDGKETVPNNPDNPKGAFTAARAAKDQGVPISTISFGTPNGTVEVNNERVPVPVDDKMMRRIAELSGGESYTAENLEELNKVYSTLQDQIGYETVRGEATTGWLRLAALVAAVAAAASLLMNRRLPL
ncbi:Ca-activated chloride channel family protein [Mycolicibacterium rutilum]|uniref:Ca-activated chloride channel family protein n=1 Tax=Mycolicibacterium rutilum TaxID=370526 RepID=A0A1H6KZ26_MYCRU|nr:VWA domain-containing protein [Mycolicibacterium rutilum]SEH81184.1 Ca-activated chloride channel family protein [Mycolicibacterium rutilum]